MSSPCQWMSDPEVADRFNRLIRDELHPCPKCHRYEADKLGNWCRFCAEEAMHKFFTHDPG